MGRSLTQREDYALYRMGLAIERILKDGSKEDKAMAIGWVRVWKDYHAVLLDTHEPFQV